VQVEYPEFVQIMTTKLDKQNEDAYALKDDSTHKTMILDKLSTQTMNLKNIWTRILFYFILFFVAIFCNLVNCFSESEKKMKKL
jgi:hypothetical protein